MDIDDILSLNRDLQKHIDGIDPSTLDSEDRTVYIRNMVIALENELHEALNEVGWKPWATYRHLNRDAYLSEMIDVLFFWCKLVLVANPQPGEVSQKFEEKLKRNYDRYSVEYTGVDGKCAGCHRSFDDIKALNEEGVHSSPYTSDKGLVYCNYDCWAFRT